MSFDLQLFVLRAKDSIFLVCDLLILSSYVPRICYLEFWNSNRVARGVRIYVENQTTSEMRYDDDDDDFLMVQCSATRLKSLVVALSDASMDKGMATRVRLVKCPKCRMLLAEVADVPVYRCGGCDTILRGNTTCFFISFSFTG